MSDGTWRNTISETPENNLTMEDLESRFKAFKEEARKPYPWSIRGDAMSNGRLSETYRAQEGCHNCRHVIIEHEYEEGVYFYCTLSPPSPPKKGDCGHRPSFYCDSATFAEAWRVWAEWKEGREVQPWAICDGFEQKEGGSH